MQAANEVSMMRDDPTVIQSMSLADVQTLISDEMADVDNFIRDRLRSDVVLINQIAEHIVSSGGKRLRPMLVLLAARAAGYSGREHVALAAIVEFIHTATLLHDDVVDESELRRGRRTANAVWGNAASVLVGDFLYSRSFQMMVDVGRMRVMEILSDATNAIAEGEVLQLLHRGNPDTDEASYFKVIRNKTAVLFEAATRLGGLLAGIGEEREDVMARYGLNLGMAFQIADDMLDYTATAQDLGKNIGDDIAEGKPTLPLMHALANGTPEQQAMIRHAIEHGGLEQMPAILKAIEDTGALAYSHRRAVEYADAAHQDLVVLLESPYTQALHSLADYAVSRNF